MRGTLYSLGEAANIGQLCASRTDSCQIDCLLGALLRQSSTATMLSKYMITRPSIAREMSYESKGRRAHFLAGLGIHCRD
jgi:hypothetical protein